MYTLNVDPGIGERLEEHFTEKLARIFALDLFEVDEDLTIVPIAIDEVARYVSGVLIKVIVPLTLGLP
jgi:hypothetical protein